MHLLYDFWFLGIKSIKRVHQFLEIGSSEHLTYLDNVLDLVEHVEDEWLVLDLLGEQSRCKLIVPNCSLLGHLLELPETVQLGVQSDVCHARVALLDGGHFGLVVGHVQVGLVVGLWLIELTLFDFDHERTLSAHLI